MFQSGKYAGNGTGFWISGDGWLLTNQHVVGDFKSIDLRLADGKVVPASVEAVDRKNDLAVLKAGHRPSAWLPVSKGEKELGLGQMVFTIGYPNALIQGLEPKFTDGKISSQTGMGDDRNFYQTSIPVQPGNSGGPLVDFSTGWVVGVMSQRLDVGSDGRAVQSASYAVKCSLMTGFLASLAAVEQSRKEFPAPPLPKGDASGITDRVRNATVLVLTPR